MPVDHPVLSWQASRTGSVSSSLTGPPADYFTELELPAPSVCSSLEGSFPAQPFKASTESVHLLSASSFQNGPARGFVTGRVWGADFSGHVSVRPGVVGPSGLACLSEPGIHHRIPKQPGASFIAGGVETVCTDAGDLWRPGSRGTREGDIRGILLFHVFFHLFFLPFLRVFMGLHQPSRCLLILIGPRLTPCALPLYHPPAQEWRRPGPGCQPLLPERKRKCVGSLHQVRSQSLSLFLSSPSEEQRGQHQGTNCDALQHRVTVTHCNPLCYRDIFLLPAVSPRTFKTSRATSTRRRPRCRRSAL